MFEQDDTPVLGKEPLHDYDINFSMVQVRLENYEL